MQPVESATVPPSLRLIGERVILRPPAHSDVDAFTVMFTDPEVMRFVA